MYIYIYIYIYICIAYIIHMCILGTEYYKWLSQRVYKLDEVSIIGNVRVIGCPGGHTSSLLYSQLTPPHCRNTEGRFVY